MPLDKLKSYMNNNCNISLEECHINFQQPNFKILDNNRDNSKNEYYINNLEINEYELNRKTHKEFGSNICLVDSDKMKHELINSNKNNIYKSINSIKSSEENIYKNIYALDDNNKYAVYNNETFSANENFYIYNLEYLFDKVINSHPNDIKSQEIILNQLQEKLFILLFKGTKFIINRIKILLK